MPWKENPEPLSRPLSAGYKGGRAVLGCNNIKVQHNYGHVNLLKELIMNNVLKRGGVERCDFYSEKDLKKESLPVWSSSLQTGNQEISTES